MRWAGLGSVSHPVLFVLLPWLILEYLQADKHMLSIQPARQGIVHIERSAVNVLNHETRLEAAAIHAAQRPRLQILAKGCGQVRPMRHSVLYVTHDLILIPPALRSEAMLSTQLHLAVHCSKPRTKQTFCPSLTEGCDAV